MSKSRIATAEMLAVGAELLAGETRDTNSGDIAAELTGLGVAVGRMSQIPDDLEIISGTVQDALRRCDLVVTSGGLGPTPDDLTREGIARALGETPRIDPKQEAWLRKLWADRGLEFTDVNLKQAWLIPSAVALANPNGSAPGWWVERDDKIVIALPGPPRELKPMWRDHALPRLRARGLGLDRFVQTLHLTGIGESLVVDLIGADLLERENPRMATYARADAVDLRVSANGSASRDGAALVQEAVAGLSPRIDPYLFARDDEGWAEALGARLAGRRLATAEVGAAGYLGLLLGTAPFLARAVQQTDDAGEAADLAADARSSTGADIGLAAWVHDTDDDPRVDLAIATDATTHVANQSLFRGGDAGRRRAANLALAELWRWLGS